MEYTEDIEETKEAPKRKGITSFMGVALPTLAEWEACGAERQFALAHKLGVCAHEIREEIRRRAMPAPGARNGQETQANGKRRGMTKTERDLHIRTLVLPPLDEWDKMEIVERYDHVPPGGYTPGDVRLELARRAKADA